MNPLILGNIYKHELGYLAIWIWMYETFRDCVISSFCLSHCYEWSVLSPGYYKSLDVILVSRVTDPSIPFVIMCEIILSLTFSLLFSYGDKKTKTTQTQATQTHKTFLICGNIFFTDPGYFILVRSS